MVYKFWASQTGEREGNKGKVRVGKMKKTKRNMKREESRAVDWGKVMRFTSNSKGTDFQIE